MTDLEIFLSFVALLSIGICVAYILYFKRHDKEYNDRIDHLSKEYFELLDIALLQKASLDEMIEITRNIRQTVPPDLDDVTRLKRLIETVKRQKVVL